MARFRCPTSFFSDATSTAGGSYAGGSPLTTPLARKSSTTTNRGSKRVAEQPCRLRSRLERVRPSSDDLAASKARRERILRRQQLHVYVGNLSVSTTVNDIKVHFASCEPLGPVIIRCGRFPHAQDKELLGPNYATIAFANRELCGRAMRMHGTDLHGHRVMVCRNPIELPEADRIKTKVLDRRGAKVCEILNRQATVPLVWVPENALGAGPSDPAQKGPSPLKSTPYPPRYYVPSTMKGKGKAQA